MIGRLLSSSIRRRRTQRSGFTLIEILVVIVVISILATLVAPSIFQNVGTAKSTTAKSQIESLVAALDQYRLGNMAYPTTDQGLEALWTAPANPTAPSWNGPYLRKPVPPDPWNNPYIYVCPGEQNPNGFDLYSLGADGKLGGEGENADIVSWK
jgi:general secretion pathway protein G